MIRKLILKSIQPILAFILFIIIWEISSHILNTETWVLPAPSIIAAEMWDVIPVFLPHMVSTIKLVLIGFIIGTTTGLCTGTILHHSVRIKETIYPFLIISQNIPIIVLAPLLIIWFGLGDTPKIIIIAMTSFFPITVATLGGLQQTARELVHYMRMMGSTKRQSFLKLELPHALPSIFSGVKISATYSVMTGVVAEWIGAQKGIGVFMTLASASYQTPRVFVAIIITMLLSLTFFAIVNIFERIFIKWNRGEAKE